MHLMSFPSSNPWFCNLCHHGLLTCKRCNRISSVLSGTSASMGSSMDRDLVSYKYFSIVLLLVMDLALFLPCTMQMLEIHSYGVLLSYMWYTKRLLFCPCCCSGLVGMLSSSYPPSNPQWLDLSSYIVSLTVAGIP
jgi:hypothetical protein